MNFSLDSLPALAPWSTLSRKTVFPGTRFLSVEQHVVRLPDGRVVEDWPWIIAPDFVLVAGRDEDGRFLCFHQYKYGVGGETLAPVGGHLEPGEDPLVAARREFLEETGHEAAEWIPLGRFVTDANRGGCRASLFLARGARRVAKPASDDLEEQRLLRLTREEVRSALDRGAFKVLAWAAVMEMALQQAARPAG